jgi:hypothetical protein
MSKQSCNIKIDIKYSYKPLVPNLNSWKEPNDLNYGRPWKNSMFNEINAAKILNH